MRVQRRSAAKTMDHTITWGRLWSRVATFILALTFSVASVAGQNTSDDDALELLPPASTQRVQKPTVTPTVVEPVDCQQVVELTRSGLDDQIIADVVRERGLSRPLSVDDLLFLRRSRVSNEVIRAMQQIAPKAAVYEVAPTVVHVESPPPPPVIIRTVPRYYWGFSAPVYVRPPSPRPYPHHGHPHPRGGSRISFGFSF